MNDGKMNQQRTNNNHGHDPQQSPTKVEPNWSFGLNSTENDFTHDNMNHINSCQTELITVPSFVISSATSHALQLAVPVPSASSSLVHAPPVPPPTYSWSTPPNTYLSYDTNAANTYPYARNILPVISSEQIPDIKPLCSMPMNPVPIPDNSIVYNHQSPCPYACKNCGASFESIPTLKVHLADGHCQNDEYVPSIHKSLFTKKIHGQKNIHQNNWDKESSNCKSKSESAQRNHKCETCDKRFQYRWILQRHMKIHSGEKEFECEICGKKFRHKANAKVHLVKHDPNSKIDCALCGKQFKWKASFKRHKCLK